MFTGYIAVKPKGFWASTTYELPGARTLAIALRKAWAWAQELEAAGEVVLRVWAE